VDSVLEHGVGLHLGRRLLVARMRQFGARKVQLETIGVA